MKWTGIVMEDNKQKNLDDIKNKIENIYKKK